MDKCIIERAIAEGRCIVDKKSTTRKVAKIFDVCKSTVHKDVTVVLEKENPSLAKEVRKVLDVNKQERHIRGGMATKAMYEATKGRK